MTDGPSRVVRSARAVWKEKTSEAQLAHFVADFVAKREDQLVQEERWRQKMMSRLGDKFDHVDARLDEVSQRVEDLAGTCAEIKAMLAERRRGT